MKVSARAWMLALCPLALFLAAAGTTKVRAYEGELEWESVPRPGIVNVNYRERPDGDQMRQRLIVTIQNAAPHTSFDIFVESRYIGNVTTDRFGAAELDIRKRNVWKGPDGRPRANRRVDEGDMCYVHAAGDEPFSDAFTALN